MVSNLYGDTYFVRAVCLGFVEVKEFNGAYKYVREHSPCFVLLTDKNNNIYHYDLKNIGDIRNLINDSHLNEEPLMKINEEEAKNYMCIKHKTDALIRRNEALSEANKKIADELFGALESDDVKLN